MIVFLCMSSRSEEDREEEGVSPGGASAPLPEVTSSGPEGLRPCAWTLPSGSPGPPGASRSRGGGAGEAGPLTPGLRRRAGQVPAQPGPRRPSAGHRKPRGRQRARPGSARRGGRGLRSHRAPRPIPASRPKPRPPGHFGQPGSARSSAPCV